MASSWRKLRSLRVFLNFLILYLPQKFYNREQLLGNNSFYHFIFFSLDIQQIIDT